MIEPLLGKPGRVPGSRNLRPEERAAREPGYERTYRSRYPMRRRAIWLAGAANQRAVRLGVAGRIHLADVLAVWERQPACVSCGSGRGLDHIVAMVDGGANERANLQNLCVPCNRKKGAVRSMQFERQTHCRNGHEFTADSVFVPKDGRRRCRPCRNAYLREKRVRDAFRGGADERVIPPSPGTGLTSERITGTRAAT